MSQTSVRLRVYLSAAFLAASFLTAAQAADVYYFNYDNSSDGQGIADETGNGHNLGVYYNGSFQFAPLSGAVPVVGTARAFDVASSIDVGDGMKKGGLTDVMWAADPANDPFEETGIITSGGYTFETWVKRNPNDGLAQHIWNPEGMHSIEILGAPFDPVADPNDQTLQFAIRGVDAWWLPVNEVLPAGDWHHLMATMAVVDGGNPGDVTYTLQVDGVQVGRTLEGNLGASFTTLLQQQARHGIGWAETGNANFGLNGQLAYTRLALGIIPYEDSYAFAKNIPGYVPEPSSMALLMFAGLTPLFARRRSS
jgi:hypothetical protein